MQRNSNQRNASLAKESETAQLQFSKKARHVDWQPKTMKEYRRLQPKEYVELGKLPADLNSPKLIQKVLCGILGWFSWVVVLFGIILTLVFFFFFH